MSKVIFVWLGLMVAFFCFGAIVPAIVLALILVIPVMIIAGLSSLRR